MKKSLPVLLIFLMLFLTINVDSVFAVYDEKLEFYHNNKVFTYSLAKNIKQNTQFDLNYKINKYNRFTSKLDRQKLLNSLLKIDLDAEICLEYLFPNLNKLIKTMEKCINQPALDANLRINPNSEQVFYISSEINGEFLNKQLLIKNIIQNYLNNQKLEFKLPINQLLPQITSRDLKSFTNLRADFSTNIENSTPDRKHNIKNALQSINKSEIMPNTIFSFNSIVGRRTESNGYRNAKIIVNNEYVEGIGGGVCQVSSTLYNTALLAGLEIIEANKHSKQISYVKYGFDAMVNFGSSDFKFKNNTNEKLIIITNYTNSNIRIRIFGESLNNTHYKLHNEISDIIEPSEEILTDEDFKYLDKVKYSDEFFYFKKANKGMIVKSYREKYVNNVLVSKELLRNDVYPVQNAVKIYGSIPRPKVFDSLA